MSKPLALVVILMFSSLAHAGGVIGGGGTGVTFELDTAALSAKDFETLSISASTAQPVVINGEYVEILAIDLDERLVELQVENGGATLILKGEETHH